MDDPMDDPKPRPTARVCPYTGRACQSVECAEGRCEYEQIEDNWQEHLATLDAQEADELLEELYCPLCNLPTSPEAPCGCGVA